MKIEELINKSVTLECNERGFYLTLLYLALKNNSDIIKIETMDLSKISKVVLKTQRNFLKLFCEKGLIEYTKPYGHNRPMIIKLL